MLTLIRNGGFPMLFILLFGLFSLCAAGWFAIRLHARIVGFIKWMTAATLFATLSGTCSDLAATSMAVVAKLPTDAATATQMAFEGFAESMSPGIMGFSFAALTAMLVAVGRRRLDAREG